MVGGCNGRSITRVGRHPGFQQGGGGCRGDEALTSSQGCGQLEAQGLSLGVKGRADGRSQQVLHQLGLGAPGCVVLDAVVAAQGHREPTLQEALCGAHVEPAGPRLHIALLEVLEGAGEGSRHLGGPLPSDLGPGTLIPHSWDMEVSREESRWAPQPFLQAAGSLGRVTALRSSCLWDMGRPSPRH